MKYASVEDIVASFPLPILQTVQDEPEYQMIHVIRKLLQANARAIYTRLGSGALGHLGLVVSDAAYAIITPTGEHVPILWTKQTSPGREPAVLDQGTSAQLSTFRYSWEQAVLTYRTFNTVQQLLKKQIITVFEPMYLEILNDDIIGFANITAREMIDHLFLTYCNITTVDLENNFEQMRKAWDAQQPLETLFKQIQD
jgi:hypothetical protein